MPKTENTEFILTGAVAEMLGVDVKTAKKLMEAPDGIRSCYIQTQLKTTKAEVRRFMESAINGEVVIRDLVRPISTQIRRTKPVTSDRLHIINSQLFNSRKGKNETRKKSA